VRKPALSGLYPTLCPALPLSYPKPTIQPALRLACAVPDPAQRGRARFKNLDKLVHHANLDGRVNVFYSSPAAYTAAKHAYNLSWPLKTDDFFPYADCPTCYWTGARAPAPRAQPAARALRAARD